MKHIVDPLPSRIFFPKQNIKLDNQVLQVQISSKSIFLINFIMSLNTIQNCKKWQNQLLPALQTVRRKIKTAYYRKDISTFLTTILQFISISISIQILCRKILLQTSIHFPVTKSNITFLTNRSTSKNGSISKQNINIVRIKTVQIENSKSSKRGLCCQHPAG